MSQSQVADAIGASEFQVRYFLLYTIHYSTVGELIMTAPIATREKVFAAAEKIFSKGEVVTIEKIRVEIGGGSPNTISKYLKEWKEQTNDDVKMISSPIPDSLKKVYEEINQTHWDVFRNRYELIVDNEKILELEKENESLRDKLEIAKQNSIRLEESEKYRKELSERYDKAMEQRRSDAIKIEKLERKVNELTS